MNSIPTESGATEFLAYLTVGQVALAALILTIIRIWMLRQVSSKTSKEKEPDSLSRSIAEICESLIIAGVLVFFIIRPFFVQAFFIPSESMENTLMGHDPGTNMMNQTHLHSIHDRIFVNKLIYRYSNPTRGSIIVFLAPAGADSEDQAKGLPMKQNVLIKRVIGIPGDTIQIKQYGDADYVYRNNQPLNEYHGTNPPAPPPPPGAINTDYSIKEPMNPDLNSNFLYGYAKPVHLAANQYWVMGDNRNDSWDSRYWGLLSRRRIMGKAEVIFWPLDRIRILH